jgi:hypothetical protein
MSAETQAEERPERPDFDTTHVLWAAGAALLLLFGAIAVFSAIYLNEVAVRTVPPPEKFPAPQLRVDEHAQLEQIVAEQRKRLTEYRWIDEKRRIAQVPIERAMQILASEGEKAYAPLIPPRPALSSPTSGAERAITPPGDGQPNSGTIGQPSSDTDRPRPPAKADQPQSPQTTPRENAK